MIGSFEITKFNLQRKSNFVAKTGTPPGIIRENKI
jgi:hypothetical protein